MFSSKNPDWGTLFISKLRGSEIISLNLSKKWSIDRLNETEKSILRLATYELLFFKKFKKLTIINEYISIIEVFGGSPDFANGILENISKDIQWI